MDFASAFNAAASSTTSSTSPAALACSADKFAAVKTRSVTRPSCGTRRRIYGSDVDGTNPSFASCSAKKAPFTATTKSHTHAKPRPALSAEPCSNAIVYCGNLCNACNTRANWSCTLATACSSILDSDMMYFGSKPLQNCLPSPLKRTTLTSFLCPRSTTASCSASSIARSRALLPPLLKVRFAHCFVTVYFKHAWLHVSREHLGGFEKPCTCISHGKREYIVLLGCPALGPSSSSSIPCMPKACASFSVRTRSISSQVFPLNTGSSGSTYGSGSDMAVLHVRLTTHLNS
mmetsp:Transcript_41969/g.94308  ORF Transcript_41969/g.94308 Transcript_41969/m.94308 type:complete len:290 (+) Transcript_41969:373-1242(+)